MEVCDFVQEAVIKTIPKKKKCKTAKWLSEEVLQIAEKRREVKGKGEKKTYTHLNAEFQRIARTDKTAFLKTRSERDTCTPMFIAELFTIAEIWKQSKCPLMEIKNVTHTNTCTCMYTHRNTIQPCKRRHACHLQQYGWNFRALC